MDWQAITQDMIASAPGVFILAGLFAKQIVELRKRDALHDERLSSVERKLSRLCDDANLENTGRHDVPEEQPPTRKLRRS